MFKGLKETMLKEENKVGNKGNIEGKYLKLRSYSTGHSQHHTQW